jgi:hypothetical protein
MSFHAFPKIFAVGTDYIRDLFDGPVEVTEKIDGSQFIFGRFDGEVRVRSRGREIFRETADKLFSPAVEFAFAAPLPEGVVFYGETLAKPKHNTLAYERVPKSNVALFGASSVGGTFCDYAQLSGFAGELGCDVVPVIYEGVVESVAQLTTFLERGSYLGGTTVEGVVVKNYAKPFLLGGQPIPLMAGKLVSEKFKERHIKDWSRENTSRGKWDVFVDGFRTEARWQKAVQHLRDASLLDGAPRDIGKLIVEVKRDIAEEESEAIRDFLWREFGDDLLRKSISGLPEWYKMQLAARMSNWRTRD